MSNPIRLTLILAEFVDGYRTQLQHSGTVDIPTLELMLGRGEVAQRAERSRNLNRLQQNVLEAAGLDVGDARHASAPLTWLGQTGTRRPGTLMHAELVHFTAGMTDVALAMVREVGLQQRDELMQSLASLVREAGFELVRAAPGAWYLVTECVLDVTTFSPGHVTANGLYASMPTGKDASALRTLMTELQMTLHGHAINGELQGRGLPALNSVWFWGAGSYPGETKPLTLPAAFADDAYVKGLWSSCGSEVQPLPSSAQQALSSLAADTIVVLRPMTVEQLEQQWLAPSYQALKASRTTQLVIRFDEWTIMLTGAQARRFWKSPRPLSQLGDAFEIDGQ